MKNLSMKFMLIGTLFAASITLLFTHIACTNSAMKGDIDFDLQAGKINMPYGSNDL